MDDPFKNIFNFLKTEKLSVNERIQMKNVLLSVMKDNPMQASSPMVSRYEHILRYILYRHRKGNGFLFAFCKFDCDVIGTIKHNAASNDTYLECCSFL